MDIAGIPVDTSEDVPRDRVYAQREGSIIVHPLMAVQLGANGDHAKWLRDAEAWIVSRATRRADAAIRKLGAA